MTDYTRAIEEAKKHGIDMSWLAGAAAGGAGLPGGAAGSGAATGAATATQAPAIQATGGIERLSPGAQQLMQAIQHAQTQTPVYMPFAPGTPTQRRREADTSAQQWQTGHEFDREQFDWKRDLSEREFAANEAYRQAQLALQRAAAGGGAGGAGGIGGLFNTGGTQTERANLAYGYYTNIVRNSLDSMMRGAKGAPSLEQILNSIAEEAPEMRAEGVDPAEIMRFAIGAFQQQQPRSTMDWMPGELSPYHTQQAWLNQNMKSLEEMIASMERGYRPAEAPAGVMSLSPQEKQELAAYMKITPEELEWQIRLNPSQIGQIHGRMLEDKARPKTDGW